MPLTPEQDFDFWDSKLTDLRHNQLETVQKAATAWAAFFSAALGIFGAVAFAGGLTTLDKVGSPWNGIAKGLTIVAALAALYATWRSATAAQGMKPQLSSQLDAGKYRARSARAAEEAAERLKRAKTAGFFAACLVLGGSCMVLLAGEAEKEPPKAPTVVAIIDGAAYCGELGGHGGALSVDTYPMSSFVEKVVLVDACPTTTTTTTSTPAQTDATIRTIESDATTDATSPSG